MNTRRPHSHLFRELLDFTAHGAHRRCGPPQTKTETRAVAGGKTVLPLRELIQWPRDVLISKHSFFSKRKAGKIVNGQKTKETRRRGRRRGRK